MPIQNALIIIIKTVQIIARHLFVQVMHTKNVKFETGNIAVLFFSEK